MVKYAFCPQQDETDCGAACLQMVALHYGRRLSRHRVREAVNTGQSGTTLLDLKQGAQTLGFRARAGRASPEVFHHFEEVTLPLVLHWQGNHWVVLHDRRGQRYAVADPAEGLRYLSEAELRAGWTDWVALRLYPDPERFYAEADASPDRWKRLTHRLWRDRRVLVQATAFGAVAGGLAAALPLAVQFLTDRVLLQGDRALLDAVALAALAAIGLGSLLSWIQAILAARFSQALELDFALEFAHKLLNLPLNYYESRRSGEIGSRLGDIQDIDRFLSQVAIALPGRGLVALVSVGVMAAYNLRLTAIALVGFALAVGASWLAWGWLARQNRRLLALEAETQGVMVETFKGALTLKTLAAVPRFWDELQGRFGRLARLSLRTEQLGIGTRLLSQAIATATILFLLWLGSRDVLADRLSVGQLLAFLALSTQAAAFLEILADLTDDYARTRAAVDRLSEVLEHRWETSPATRKPAVSIPADADLVFDRVTFRYPGRAVLFENFSLHLRGGQTVALMGPSGCGKSTLAKLLVGLYPTDAGTVSVGEFAVADLDLDRLRRQVVLVPQEPQFWSRSILENFRLTDPDLPFEAIVRACQLTGADEFANALPDRYDTVLGEFGASLSGGQRQRLAIARAIAADPPVLVLDEATSGLDAAGEAAVLDRLLAARQGKTTVLVSHRPAAAQRAHWVVVMDGDGGIDRQGTAYILGDLDFGDRARPSCRSMAS